MPPIYDVPVDNNGNPILIGNLLYESRAWDARMVLTAGSVWQSAFDADFYVANLGSLTADAKMSVFSAYSLRFDAYLSIPSFGSFDAKFGVGVGSVFDAKFGLGEAIRSDAVFGIGISGSMVADAAMRVWNAGSKVTLYGYFMRPDGQPLSGIGTLRISAPARLAGSVVMPAPMQVNVGTNGFFTVQLHPNADLQPPTTVYLFTLDKFTLIFRVPRMHSVWLHQLQYLQLSDPIFFQDVITTVEADGRKTYIIVRVGTKVFRLPAEPL